MFRLLMPVRMVDDTPHTALVIEVEELTMHGGPPARYYQRFQILVLIGHILSIPKVHDYPPHMWLELD